MNYTTITEAINEAWEAHQLPNERTSYDGKRAFECFGQTLYYYTQRSFNAVARYIQDGNGNNVYTWIDDKGINEDYTGQRALINYLKELQAKEEAKALKVARKLLKGEGNTGGTYTAELKEAQEVSGFYVAKEGIELDNPSFNELVEHVACMSFILKNKYSSHIVQNGEVPAFLGYWLCNGTIYLDYVMRIEDKARALELGKEFKQLAIYEIETGKEIFLK